MGLTAGRLPVLYKQTVECWLQMTLMPEDQLDCRVLAQDLNTTMSTHGSKMKDNSDLFVSLDGNHDATYRATRNEHELITRRN